LALIEEAKREALVEEAKRVPEKRSVCCCCGSAMSASDEDYDFDQEYPDEAFEQELMEKQAEDEGPMASAAPQQTGRPMSSIGAANFQKASTGGSTGYTSGARPQKIKKQQLSPERAAREREHKVHVLIQEAATAEADGELRVALEKAKEATTEEKNLRKFREHKGIQEGTNNDLTYSVMYLSGHFHHRNGLLDEALKKYEYCVNKKNSKRFTHGGRLRVNMGNIYFEQKKFAEAITQYKRALDIIPTSFKDVRYKILRNLGNVCRARAQSGDFDDAIRHFEEAIEGGNSDYRAAMNLVVANVSLENTEQIKTSYSNMLHIRKLAQEEAATRAEEDAAVAADREELDEDEEAELPEISSADALVHEERERARFADRHIIAASKLIAPVVEAGDFAKGFDFVVETLRATQNGDIADELEISKALTFMKNRNVKQAISVLREFEKKDDASDAMAHASTNLSFLYFLEQEYRNAERYADAAIRADKFNAKAYVNKANCVFVGGKPDEAKALYEEAISCESDCIPGIYNLGLLAKHEDDPQTALAYFEKLDSMVPNQAEVVYQIAHCHELLGNLREAEGGYKTILKSLMPSDAGVHARLANVYSQQGDDVQAHQYYQDSYRLWPADMEVITWLGSYYVKAEVFEKAITMFERASMLAPKEVKWKLVIAGCYRRQRQFQEAMSAYKAVLEMDELNTEALRYLVQIANDLGMKEAVEQYAGKLRQAEAENKSRTSDEHDSADTLTGKTSASEAAQSGTPGLGKSAFGALSVGMSKAGWGSFGGPQHVHDSGAFDTAGAYGESDSPPTSARAKGAGAVGGWEDNSDDEVDDFLPL
jgi:intraflagellar transport protein 88